MAHDLTPGEHRPILLPVQSVNGESFCSVLAEDRSAVLNQILKYASCVWGDI